MESLELRWFFENEIPTEINSWFTEQGGTVANEIRTDYYFPETLQGRVGMKIRGGNEPTIETKGRLEELGSKQLHGKEIGQLEKWCKWSSKAETGLMNEKGHERQGWIRIDKKRALLKFAVFPDDTTKTTQNEFVDDGCNVEITEILCNSKKYFSLCFETFHTHLDLLNNFRIVANATISGDILPFLNPESSYGYPEFIRRLK